MKKAHWLKILFVLLATLLLGFSYSSVSYADSGNGTVKAWIDSGQNKQKAPAGSSSSGEVKQDGSATYGNSNLFLTFLKLFFSLLLVLALIYLLYHFVVKRTGKFAQVNALKNMGGVSLGANRSLQLVRVGNEILVVGVGETVQLIKEITDPEAIQSLTQQAAPSDHFEENVLKALKWTTDHTLRRNEAKENLRKNAPSLQNAFQEQLDAVKKERSNQLSALIQEVRKNE